MTDIRPATMHEPAPSVCPKNAFGKKADNCQDLNMEFLDAAKECLNNQRSLKKNTLSELLAKGGCPSRAANSSEFPLPIALVAPTITSTPTETSDLLAGDIRVLTFTTQDKRKLVVEAPANWVSSDGGTVTVPGQDPTKYALAEIFSAFAAVTSGDKVATVRFLQGRSCSIFHGNMYLGPTWLVGEVGPDGHDLLTVLPTKRPGSSRTIGAWFSQFSDRGTPPHAVVVRDPERATR